MSDGEEIEALFVAFTQVMNGRNVAMNVALGAVERLRIEMTSRYLLRNGFMQIKEPDAHSRPGSAEENPR